MAHGFKVAKKLVTIIKDIIILLDNHAIVNNADFINIVSSITMLSTYKLASFDIMDLFRNVSVQEILDMFHMN